MVSRTCDIGHTRNMRIQASCIMVNAACSRYGVCTRPHAGDIELQHACEGHSCAAICRKRIISMLFEQRFPVE